MSKIVALDCDDVVCAFTPHAFKWYGKILPNRVDYWSVEVMNQLLGLDWFSNVALSEKFWEALPPLAKPEDIDFDFDYYLTSFPEQMIDHRINWLEKHGFPDKPVIISHNKKEMCEVLNIDILIDDKRSTIESLINTKTTGIHFLPHYAGFEEVGNYPIRNLREVKNIINKLQLLET